ncbi:MAG: hypothetical protein VKN72_10010 [Nostocales cyanobacterium 94392]|nr:hypothetical protein [Nostocales cyanobacterium 94392]
MGIPERPNHKDEICCKSASAINGDRAFKYSEHYIYVSIAA